MQEELHSDSLSSLVGHRQHCQLSQDKIMVFPYYIFTENPIMDLSNGVENEIYKQH